MARSSFTNQQAAGQIALAARPDQLGPVQGCGAGTHGSGAGKSRWPDAAVAEDSQNGSLPGSCCWPLTWQRQDRAELDRRSPIVAQILPRSRDRGVWRPAPGTQMRNKNGYRYAARLQPSPGFAPNQGVGAGRAPAPPPALQWPSSASSNAFRPLAPQGRCRGGPAAMPAPPTPNRWPAEVIGSGPRGPAS